MTDVLYVNDKKIMICNVCYVATGTNTSIIAICSLTFILFAFITHYYYRLELINTCTLCYQILHIKIVIFTYNFFRLFPMYFDWLTA